MGSLYIENTFPMVNSCTPGVDDRWCAANKSMPSMSIKELLEKMETCITVKAGSGGAGFAELAAYGRA